MTTSLLPLLSGNTGSLRALTQAMTACVAAIAVMALTGWAFDMPQLTSISPHWTSMKANSAIAFMLAAASLALHLAGRAHNSARSRRASAACAAAIAVIAILTLAEYAFGASFGIDELLVADGSIDTPYPGRMAPQTALSHLLIAATLLLLTRENLRWHLDALLLTGVLFMGLLGVTSYIYGVPALREIGPAGVALESAILFMLLGAGTLAARGERGFLQIFASGSAGGVVARRLLPLIVIVPLVLGWLRLKGEHLGLYGAEFGVALMAVTSVLIVAVLVAWTATSLAQADVRGIRAGAALVASERRCRALIEHSADVVALLSPDGKSFYRSPAAARVLGVDAATLADLSYAPTIHPDDEDIVRQTLAKVNAAPGNRATAEVRFRHGDGTWHWLEATLTNMLDEPSVNAFVANYRDVTEQRQTVQALRDSEQRFREIAEYIGEAFFVAETNSFKPLYVSRHWATIWARPIQDGYDAQIWLASFHADDRERVLRSREDVKMGRSTDDVFRIARPDGKTRWVHVRAYPVSAADGQIYRMVGVATDITDLRQAEERFAQAQKMEAMGRLAGGVAHDFNNLLTVILCETELLQRDAAKDSEQAEMLGDIRHAAESAASLTGQLLAFSRKQLVAPTVFDVNIAIVETSKMLRRLIGENIRLETRLAADAGDVRLDRGQLEQVLTNLAVNARDAMPTGGLLLVETSPVRLDADYASMYPEVQPGDYVLLAVNDTGVGMSPEVRANIFEPFFTTKERGEGTGLGLAMIHGIVKQAGGHIAVYSELGVGTTFRLYFPKVAESPLPARPRIEAKPLARGDETVLIVEDEEKVRAVAVRMLTSLGYTVLQARHGQEAQDIIDSRGSEIQLLFTDVVLPGMHGRELAERVRSRLPAIRVLYTSGYSDDVILQHRLLDHDVIVLEKPYNREALAAKVREALDI